jgi:hypothetical protein
MGQQAVVARLDSIPKSAFHQSGLWVAETPHCLTFYQ